jgi:general stress protein YciG
VARKPLYTKGFAQREKFPMSDENVPKKKKRRGFAAMSPEKQREIASKGGKSAHQKGTAHQFTPEEARQAGTKGGRAAADKKKQEEEDPPKIE